MLARVPFLGPFNRKVRVLQHENMLTKKRQYMFRVYVCFSNSFRYDEVVVARVVLDRSCTCLLHQHAPCKTIMVSQNLRLFRLFRFVWLCWIVCDSSFQFGGATQHHGLLYAQLMHRMNRKPVFPRDTGREHWCLAGARAAVCVCERERVCVWPQLSDRSL